MSHKNVLVLCTGNSCRSQIAHGYLKHFTDPSKVKVYTEEEIMQQFREVREVIKGYFGDFAKQYLQQ